MAGSGAYYHGGFSWAPNPAYGALTLNDEFIELTGRPQGVIKTVTKSFVKVFLPAIESVEITSEQVAKSKVGSVLAFGVLGGLAAKGSMDRGTLLVHLKNGQTGYFTIGDYSEAKLLGKLTPWLHGNNIPVRPPLQESASPQTISIADELTKLAGLRDSGILTNEEFDAAKQRLLTPPSAQQPHQTEGTT